MSDEEKQLTVAELLERAQANRGSAQRASGRRRRRSLEDGGISVAELTGSLSRVKEKPAESKHSSVPIDTPESERRSRPRTPSSPAATAPSVAGINATPLSGASFKPAAASPAAWGAPQQGPATPKSGQPTRPGAAPAAKGNPAAPARPVKAAAAAPAPAAKPEPEKKNAPAAPSTPAQQPQRPAQDKAQAPQSAQPTQGTQGSANKSPWPIPDSARRPAPRPAVVPAPAAAAPKPKAAVSTESAKESASEKTAVISPVGGTPQAEKKQAKGQAAKEHAKEKPAEETGRIPRVGDEDSAPVASLYQNAQQRPDEADAERGEREGSAEDAAPKKRPKRPAEPEPRTGAGSAVLLAVMGVVFGALVFIGFDQLWSSGLSRILVGVLAVAVTGIMVGVVHALRTARDGVSMALAAVVGVLMTFGPYIPHMLS
ncbi:hypothetical protein [Corynebacterium mastitidis]|uniref:hypothetical protein n=1 Tax=Corynebacterium mastitidis TaxID=161890 RepID=UPI00254D5FFC|nr:hypothetical protein [Corynebacterium mastitidis]MDK8450355.1 hypothetical protein [Corynebacterium mastitidis]